MNLKKIYNFSGFGGISDIFTFAGSCGKYDGYDCKDTVKTDDGFVSKKESFTVNAKITDNDGVFERIDTIKNTSNSDITLNHYAYRFCFESGDYDVYTQTSNWQNESEGKWNELGSKISVFSDTVRSCDGSAPFIALWNRQTNKGIAFHIMPQYSWEISVMKRSPESCRAHFTVVEISIKDNSLSIPVKASEEFTLSPILYYEINDKVSMDCHKLHKYFNEKYPKKRMPVLYNSWMAFFDNISIPKIFEQIKEAKEMGCEYFVIDAGWFGDGNWERYIGTWEEYENGRFGGRLKDVSDEVHKNGMKFGLWLEPERALKNAKSVSEHPEYYFNAVDGRGYFIDFANDKAREYITELTCGLVEKYNIDFFKFDFNESITYDKRNTGFSEYKKGHTKYIEKLKRRYPDIYLECCASGGERMELEQARLFDGIWFSDNHSPYEGLTIIKNTIRRLPPYCIERYLSLVSLDGFPASYGTDNTIRTLSANNGTWGSVVSVTDEFIKGFYRGGSVGLSCNLAKLEPTFKESIKEFITKYKEERDFWIGATARILCDTDTILALQYENKGKIKVVVITTVVKQMSFTFYPVIENKDYTVNGEKKSYNELTKDGITINGIRENYSYTFNIE